MSQIERVDFEMSEFKKAALWGDGFIDADPMRPVAWSSYTSTGFVSVYHATYLACIKPYMPKDAVVMEVGPGLGAWTRTLLSAGASRVYALDVQEPTQDGIIKYLGPLRDKLTYLVVSNCEGEGVPDGVDFFWSFGTFVHLSPAIQAAYIETIARKLKPGAHGFIQFADFDIWNEIVTSPEYHVHEWMLNIAGEAVDEKMRSALKSHPWIEPRAPLPPEAREMETVKPGRYFYVGTRWISETLAKAGLIVVDENVLPSLRDPVIHFRKPEA